MPAPRFILVLVFALAGRVHADDAKSVGPGVSDFAERFATLVYANDAVELSGCLVKPAEAWMLADIVQAPEVAKIPGYHKVGMFVVALQGGVSQFPIVVPLAIDEKWYYIAVQRDHGTMKVDLDLFREQLCDGIRDAVREYLFYRDTGNARGVVAMTLDPSKAEQVAAQPDLAPDEQKRIYGRVMATPVLIREFAAQRILVETPDGTMTLARVKGAFKVAAYDLGRHADPGSGKAP